MMNTTNYTQNLEIDWLLLITTEKGVILMVGIIVGIKFGRNIEELITDYLKRLFTMVKDIIMMKNE